MEANKVWHLNAKTHESDILTIINARQNNKSAAYKTICGNWTRCDIFNKFPTFNRRSAEIQKQFQEPAGVNISSRHWYNCEQMCPHWLRSLLNVFYKQRASARVIIEGKTWLECISVRGMEANDRWSRKTSRCRCHERWQSLGPTDKYSVVRHLSQSPLPLFVGLLLRDVDVHYS